MATFKPNNRDSISEFDNWINKNTKAVNKIIAGNFYTMKYDYKAPPDTISRVPKEILDFYDGRPVAFIFSGYKAKSNGKILMVGLNFHFLPLRTRQIWISALQKISPNSFKNNSRIIIPEHLIREMIKKTKWGFRQYDINKIKRLNKIDFKDIRDILRFTPPTHEGKQYFQIEQAYKLYNPYVKRTRGK